MIVIQAIGIVAMVVGALSLVQKNTRSIRLIQIVSATLFSIHYFLLKGYAGAVLNLLSMTRNIIIGYKDKKWGNPKIWFTFYVIAFAVAVYFSGDGLKGLLPFGACVLMGLGLYLDNAKIARRIIFISCPLWLTYNIITLSIGGIIAEIINIISLGSAIIRYDILKK